MLVHPRGNQAKGDDSMHQHYRVILKMLEWLGTDMANLFETTLAKDLTDGICQFIRRFDPD